MSLFALMVATTLNTTPINKEYRDDRCNAILAGDSYTDALHKRELALQEAKRLEEEQKRRDTQARERVSRVQASPGYKAYAGAEIIGDSKENCVAYAKRASGISHPVGNGGRKSIQGSEPQVGAIGVEKNLIHAVVVEAINGNKITITEANFVKGRITRRTLDISAFKGFIYN